MDGGNQVYGGFRKYFWVEVHARCKAELKARGLQPRTVNALANKAKMLIHKRRTDPRWGTDDIEALKELRATGASWVAIAELLHRSGVACEQAHVRYNRVVKHGKLEEAEKQALERAVMHSVRRRQQMGDTRDVAVLMRQNLPWRAIARLIPGRSENTLRNSWFRYLSLEKLGEPIMTHEVDMEIAKAVKASGGENERDVAWASVHPRLRSKEALSRFEMLCRQLPDPPHRIDERAERVIEMLEEQAIQAGDHEIAKAVDRMDAGLDGLGGE